MKYKDPALSNWATAAFGEAEKPSCALRGLYDNAQRSAMQAPFGSGVRLGDAFAATPRLGDAWQGLYDNAMHSATQEIFGAELGLERALGAGPKLGDAWQGLYGNALRSVVLDPFCGDGGLGLGSILSVGPSIGDACRGPFDFSEPQSAYLSGLKSSSADFSLGLLSSNLHEPQLEAIGSIELSFSESVRNAVAALEPIKNESQKLDPFLGTRSLWYDVFICNPPFTHKAYDDIFDKISIAAFNHLAERGFNDLLIDIPAYLKFDPRWESAESTLGVYSRRDLRESLTDWIAGSDRYNFVFDIYKAILRSDISQIFQIFSRLRVNFIRRARVSSTWLWAKLSTVCPKGPALMTALQQRAIYSGIYPPPVPRSMQFDVLIRRHRRIPYGNEVQRRGYPRPLPQRLFGLLSRPCREKSNRCSRHPDQVRRRKGRAGFSGATRQEIANRQGGSLASSYRRRLVASFSPQAERSCGR